MNHQVLPWQIQSIISVANSLQRTGKSGGSTGELIAAAFVLDRMEYIPHGYSVIEAWERLDSWQRHVHRIRRDYMHLIEAG